MNLLIAEVILVSVPASLAFLNLDIGKFNISRLNVERLGANFKEYRHSIRKILESIL